jgi:amino acid adenylation domain-containing protein
VKVSTGVHKQRLRAVPLSLPQRRLWLLTELDPEDSTYNVPCAYRLRGHLDVAALEAALNAVVCRHDVLRAVLNVLDGEPAYVVDPNFRLALHSVELAPADTLASFLAREVARPFDLRAAPAIRALLVRVTADEHVLLLTFHHIITDGWSTAVFQRELGALYGACRRGMKSPLMALEATYADFAQRQLDRLGSVELSDSLHYWKEQLRDAPPFLDILPGRTGSAAATSRGRLQSRKLPEEIRFALDAVCRRYGTTRFTTLLAAFTALLYRYTGQNDLIVGTVIANRTYSEFEGLVGFFVNTLPLRARIDGDPSFVAWLASVRAMTLDAFEHQDVPFQTLIEELQPARVAARTPLINVMFLLQNVPDEPLTLEGLEVMPISVDRTTAKFDLTLEVTEIGTDLTIGFEYRTDLFEDYAVDALLDAFETLLDGISRNPEASLSGYALLESESEHRQVVEWNATARPLRGFRVERLFEEQVEAAPDAIAVEDGDRLLSYRELNERANRLAHCLRSIGVHSGARVGLCLRRSADMIVAIVAILKAGGAYVPLDPEYPGERLALMLSDAQATIVVTEGDVPQLAHAGVRLLEYNADSAPIAAFPATNLAQDVERARDPALIIFTSGSSGTPKGVLVPHIGIERLVVDPNYLTIGAADVVAQTSTITFDAATFEIWSALLNGARTVIVSKDILLAPAALRSAIDDHGITIMFLTTALFREIVRGTPDTFGALRYLLVGGEALDVESVTRLFAGRSPANFRNVYGPTEATTFATYAAIEAARPPATSIPIGRPIVNTEVYVLDAGRKLLPLGATGELYVGGPGVAIGYLNDAALNRSKFVPHPFSGSPDAKLYATGDRVRYRADGILEFLGRSDQQLKRRGFRVEPGEIETALRRSAGVGDAAVVVREDASGRPRLVGYVAVNAPDRFATNTLMRELRARVPAHLVPDSIVAVAALPLKSTGKVDYGALRAQPVRAVIETAIPAANEEQAQLVSVWERLLDVRPIGIRNDFFDLAGHSLLAMRMIAEVEEIFGVRLPLSLLFEEPTIENLEAALRNHAATRIFDRSPMVAVNTAGTAPPLFFLHGSINGSGYYSFGLAKRLGVDRPVYILRPHGVDGSSVPPTIEAMAADYINILRAARPHGPYVLGGWCNGALVAFEMARQLRGQNERVDNVILIEVEDANQPLRALIESVDHVRKVLKVNPQVRSRVVRSIARVPFHLRRLKVRSSRQAILRKISVKLGQLGRFFERAQDDKQSAATTRDVLVKFGRASEAYVPRRYDGQITLMVAHNRAFGRMPTAGWKTVAPHVDVRTIPGNHTTCVTDYIDETAKELADALAGNRSRAELGGTSQ